MAIFSHIPFPPSKTNEQGKPGALALLTVLLVSLSNAVVLAQGATPQTEAVIVEGFVHNSVGEPVFGAAVSLEDGDRVTVARTQTNAQGSFVLSALVPGNYKVKAQKSGMRDAVTVAMALAKGEPKHLTLVLESVPASQVPSSSPSASPRSARSLGSTMELADKPTFTVAGVTDWTGAGGHGSDSTLRTSEALAQQTFALSAQGASPTATTSAMLAGKARKSENELRAALAQTPGSFEANRQLGEFYFLSKRYREAIPLLETAYQINPENHANANDLAVAYEGEGDLVRAREQAQKILATSEQADTHRLLGNLNERLNDPLGAEREYEQASRLDPSEQNYFQWGAELLRHRAVQPAIEVFAKGSAVHPNSWRMLAGLGAALYAGGAYDEAAHRLCAASDLNPTEPAPYLFLGKMQKAANGALPCVEQILARFTQERPGDALANYYYALALWKRDRGQSTAGRQQVEALLARAVSIDPQLAEAYQQQGIMYSARNSFEQAVIAYQRAIAANPRLGEAHYGLALAYKRIGKQSKAQEEFQEYKQLEKTEAEEVERRRRELRQFLVILKEQPAASLPH